MSNNVIAGTGTGGATALPVANSIDGSLDYIPIYTASLTATQAINRNTFLNIASQPVGLTDSQALTNKTLGNTNTVTVKDTLFTLQDDGDTTKQAKFQLSGITTGNTRTLTVPDASDTIVGLAATQTLTNKTLTSPTINSPTITNATISADTLTGFTVSNNGTVYGISVTGGTIGSAALAANAVTTSAIANTAVTPSKLGLSPQTALVITSETTTSTSYTQLTTTTDQVTVTIGGNGLALVSLFAGAFNSGSNLSLITYQASGANTIAASDNNIMGETSVATETVTGGTKLLTGLNPGSTTFKMVYRVSAGTGTFERRNISVVPL